MFIAFLAAAASTVPKATPIAIRSWFSAGDYPAEAAKKGVEGDVTFDVDVDVDGKPTACRITGSSGSDLLDQATCRIVLAKGQFVPAKLHGKLVPGHYSDKAVWRLQDAKMIPANGYVAAILDFSKDPRHPTCSLVRKGTSSGPGCDEALKKFGEEGVRDNITKLVALMTLTTGDAKPFRGEADWGPRVSFVAIDLYAPKHGGMPACELVTEEGPELPNPCSHYNDAHALSDADKQSAYQAHVEQSVFAILQRSPSAAKCKDGESAAEADSCI